MSKNVRRLFASFQPENYQLELWPDRAKRKMRGWVTIRGKKVGRPSQRLTLHQKGLKILSAQIARNDKKGQQQIAVTRINTQETLEELRLHAGQMLHAGNYHILIEFEAPIQDSMHGVYVCNFELDGQKKQLVATQFESCHAREAFPCIDEPEAKATFDLALNTPKGEAVIANTPARFQEDDGELTGTVFETTPRMSTYLLAFVYGDLHCKEARTKNGVDVRVWATKAQPAAALDFALDVGVRAIEFFDEYYGVPYPLAKCDHVALPDFSSGAMENWGLITYRESCLLADPATTTQSARELICMVISHELSHQWFGDLVTMRWWDDLWLNESFANVMEYVATDALFPQWRVWNTFAAQEGLSAIRRDAIAGVQSVKMPVHHPDEIDTLFDPSIVYAKGSRLLNMMFRYLGEDAFRRGIKQYFQTHAYGNTTGADLWNALGAASGKDIAGFMTPWLEQPGFPLLRATQKGARLQVAQSHFLLDMAKADTARRWPVPLFASQPAADKLLEKPEVEVTLASPAYVRLNQGALGHYVVQYTEPQHAQAIAALAETQQLGVAERLMLLSDSSMLARAGIHSFAETMRLLSHYAQENSEPVWDIMALTIADCRRFIDINESLETPLKALTSRLVEPQYERLGWKELPNESVEDTKLRAIILALGVYGEHAQILPEALKLFERYKKDAAAVPSELRDIVFAAAVRHNTLGAFDYLLDLEQHTQNADLKMELTGALTVTKSAAHGKRLLARIKDATQVRQQDIERWVAFLLRNRYTQQLAWDWLRTEWPWLEKTFQGDKSYDGFPRYAASAFNTQTRLKEYAQFFDPKRSQTALARNIAMGVEELTTRVIWLERDVQAIAKILKN